MAALGGAGGCIDRIVGLEAAELGSVADVIG